MRGVGSVCVYIYIYIHIYIYIYVCACACVCVCVEPQTCGRLVRMLEPKNQDLSRV